MSVEHPCGTGIRLYRWNQDWGRWETWSPITGCWMDSVVYRLWQSPRPRSTVRYCDTWAEPLAEELGVDPLSPRELATAAVTAQLDGYARLWCSCGSGEFYADTHRVLHYCCACTADVDAFDDSQVFTRPDGLQVVYVRAS